MNGEFYKNWYVFYTHQVVIESLFSEVLGQNVTGNKVLDFGLLGKKIYAKKKNKKKRFKFLENEVKFGKWGQVWKMRSSLENEVKSEMFSISAYWL